VTIYFHGRACRFRSILDVAREHDVELEGACEGTLSCSTCHCIFDKELFDTLPPPEEEELDMLDLAAAPTDTYECSTTATATTTTTTAATAAAATVTITTND
jgi:ferredoxin